MELSLERALSVLDVKGELWSSSQTLCFILFCYLSVCQLSNSRRLSLSSRVAALQNLLLAIGSLLLCGLVLYEITQHFDTTTHWFDLFCDSNGAIFASGSIQRIQFANFMLKLLELTYSPFLGLSGRSVSAMHQWHHICMLTICWSQLGPLGCTAQWLPILVNSATHVYMFFCLFSAWAFGSSRWNSVLPKLQLLQAVVSALVLGATLLTRFLHDFVEPAKYQRCTGSWSRVLLACGLVALYPLAYLLLHRKSAEEDAWLGERGLGLFVWICGREVKTANARLKRSANAQKDE